MDGNDQCHWPRCRQPPGIALGFADIRLCDKHWEDYCAIDLEEAPTIGQIVKHEKRCLRLQAKCGSALAKRRLAQMDRDLDNYTLQTVGNGDGNHKTVAEYREAIATRAALATAVESSEHDDEDDDEFGDLGDYL